jgi:hypothetical protein
VLTAGIIVMVVSLVLGVIALTLVALMSSAARTAGRRTRTAMGLSGPEERRDYPAEAEGPYYPAEQEVRDHPPQAPAPAAAEAEQPARWVLALVVISGAGLGLGLLMVMIGTIS